jgi:phytoene dehydrogenase-like protein
MAESYDAIVIGSGPNGLAAAITIAQAGRSVLVREANSTIGGSCRSAELTLPGFTHDICSTVQALSIASPFMRSQPLGSYGLELCYAKAEYAQPLDDGTAAVAFRSTEATASTLGGGDGSAWKAIFDPIARNWDALLPTLLGPPSPFTRHPLAMLNFGLKALRTARGFADWYFEGARAKALFAGVAAHSILPLEWWATAAFGLVLGTSAHVGGWPVAKGGSQKVVDALVSILKKHGGKIETDARVKHLDELPPAKAILCDLTPRQLAQMAGDKLPSGYKKALEKFRYGPGVFKVDWALNAPIPWKAHAVRDACTIHLCGTFDEVAASEKAAWKGEHSTNPYTLLVQYPTDPTRAPEGKHTAWAYCHVPHGSNVDMTETIERQVERFAPGFRDTILARNVMNPAAMERHNANLIGGDITGGANMLSQVFTRPAIRMNNYATPVKGLYLCSASTPPGGGVHGMCGYNAAKAALAGVLR